MKRVLHTALAVVVAALCLSTMLPADDAPDRVSPNLESLRDEIKILELQGQLQAAQAALQNQLIQQQLYAQEAETTLFQAAYPYTKNTENPSGIKESGFEMPVRLQAVRSCKRLTKAICNEIGKPTGDEREVLIVTDLSLLPKLQAYRQVLTEMDALKVELAAEIRRLNDLRLKSKTPAGKDTHEGLSVPNAAFIVAKSTIGGAAEIAKLLRTKTDFKGVNALTSILEDQALACQLSDGLKKQLWTTRIATVQVGSGKNRPQAMQTRTAAALVQELLGAADQPADKNQPTANKQPAARKQPSDSILQSFRDLCTLCSELDSLSLTTKSDAPKETSASTSKDESSEGTKTKERGAKDRKAKVPNTQSGQHTPSQSDKTTTESSQDLVPSVNSVVLARAQGFVSFLLELEPGIGMTRLSALDAVGKTLDYKDSKGPRKVRYLLCAKLEFADGAIRNYSNLFNSGTISFSAGVGVTYALIGPDNEVVAADSVYDYAGWQRLQDESDDVPINSYKERSRNQ